MTMILMRNLCDMARVAALGGLPAKTFEMSQQGILPTYLWGLGRGIAIGLRDWGFIVIPVWGLAV